MKTIIVHNQSEWDALPEFKELTVVRIESPSNEWVRVAYKESAHVEAWGSAHVEAWGSAHVVARGSAHVVARESAHVEAWESAHVEAWGSAHVVARGSAHVEAWGSAHVEAWGSAHVECSQTCLVLVLSIATTIIAKQFCAIFNKCNHKSIKHTNKSLIIVEKYNNWFEKENVTKKKETAILYKRVSNDFKTQENTSNETVWSIGKTLEIAANNFDTQSECGPGKFHACSMPYFCDEFRDTPNDRYIAIRVNVKNTHETQNAGYPHKIAFRKGTVLYECDRYGKKIGD